MTSQLRFGVVGCGHLLQKGLLRHLLCADFEDKARVVALCDAVPGRARSLAERYAVAESYEHLNAMLDAAHLDALLVLTPVPLHYEHAMAGLRAGTHVYVQKTMALIGEQALEMVQTAEANRLVLAAAPGQMLSPAFQQMKRLVDENGLGRVMWCYAGANTGNDAETLGSDGIDRTWQYHYGGGALWNTAVYSLHALTGILGPARAVLSRMSTVFPKRRRDGVPFDVTEVDNALLTLEFEGGVLGTTWGCRSWSGQVLDWGAIGLYGTSGSVEATRIHMESGWPEELAWHGREHRIYRYPKGGFASDADWPTPLAPPPHADLLEQHVYLDIFDFVSAVLERRVPVASARHAAHVVEIIEKAYVAARTGREQLIVSTF
jgi:predicted dehydrogenase